MRAYYLRLAAACSGVGALFLIAGCGASSGISTHNVINHFLKETGDLLLRDSSAGNEDWDVLDFGKNAPVTSTDEYGVFSIYVVNKNLDTSRATLLSDDNGNPIKPGAGGIFWQRLDNKTVTATRQYGKNIFLVWYGSKIGETESTWDRLDSILTDLVKPVTNATAVSTVRDVSSGAGKDQPYREALKTAQAKAEYDTAFDTCSNKGGLATLLQTGGETDPETIATGVANLLAREARNAFERTAHAREIWHRSCLDALGVTQSSPSTAPLTHQKYPLPFVIEFMNGCTQGGGSRSTCMCVLHRAERQYSMEQFEQLSGAVNKPSSPLYGKAQALVHPCRPTQ
jgi:hypothetical protein